MRNKRAYHAVIKYIEMYSPGLASKNPLTFMLPLVLTQATVAVMEAALTIKRLGNIHPLTPSSSRHLSIQALPHVLFDLQVTDKY
jgi:hypothetical protein